MGCGDVEDSITRVRGMFIAKFEDSNSAHQLSEPEKPI